LKQLNELLNYSICRSYCSCCGTRYTEIFAKVSH